MAVKSSKTSKKVVKKGAKTAKGGKVVKKTAKKAAKPDKKAKKVVKKAKPDKKAKAGKKPGKVLKKKAVKKLSRQAAKRLIAAGGDNVMVYVHQNAGSALQRYDGTAILTAQGPGLSLIHI